MILSGAETEEPEKYIILYIPWTKKCREMSHGGYVLNDRLIKRDKACIHLPIVHQ